MTVAPHTNTVQKKHKALSTAAGSQHSINVGDRSDKFEHINMKLNHVLQKYTNKKWQSAKDKVAITLQEKG